MTSYCVEATPIITPSSASAHTAITTNANVRAVHAGWANTIAAVPYIQQIIIRPHQTRSFQQKQCMRVTCIITTSCMLHRTPIARSSSSAHAAIQTYTLCVQDQHDDTSVVYLHSKMAHEGKTMTSYCVEGTPIITISKCMQAHTQQLLHTQTYALFVQGGLTRRLFHTFSIPANEHQRRVIIAIDCSAFEQQNSA